MNALLTQKKLATRGPSRPTEDDWAAWKEMMPQILDEVGRGSGRYAAVRHTKIRVNPLKSKAGKEKSWHEFETNLGIIADGNTSEELKAQTVAQVKLLKAAGVIDDMVDVEWVLESSGMEAGR